MSIQAAMRNALTSLAAEQRNAAIIANNVANANTPGYVRREMPRSELLTAGTGTGVESGVTQRVGDAALAQASRLADGSEAFAEQMKALLESYNSVVGQPADERSLPTKLGTLSQALTTLSSAPDNAVAQSQALAAAQEVVDVLHATDAAVGEARAQADLAVARGVEAVNSTLDRLAEVDRQLAQASARGVSTAEYEDKREVLLADLAGKLPIRVFDNGPGRLLVQTDRGSTLYDSTHVHRLSFTGTPVIPSDVRYGGTAPYTDGLSGITMDGQELRISDSGSIAASLKMRDSTLPRFADMLDQVAGRLMESFQEADTSLAAGNAGLFVEEGSATFDALQPFTGLARTIAINPKVDPAQGGAVWKLRTGMDASAPGNAADNTFILAALDAMGKTRSYDTTTGLPAAMSLTQAASQSIGLMQSERAIWSDRADTRATLALEARTDLVNKTAVNVDEELQRLLLVKQTYAASVQIIQAASEMLDQLSQLR
jgi:flagellar hook-associated protein 1 FlgK